MQEVSKHDVPISTGRWGGETEVVQFMEFRRGNSLGALITHYKYLQGNDINEGVNYSQSLTMGGQEAVTWIQGREVWVGGNLGSRSSSAWDAFPGTALLSAQSLSLTRPWLGPAQYWCWRG